MHTRSFRIVARPSLVQRLKNPTQIHYPVANMSTWSNKRTFFHTQTQPQLTPMFSEGVQNFMRQQSHTSYDVSCQAPLGKLTGAGVILIDMLPPSGKNDRKQSEPCVVLFHDKQRMLWEDAGGMLKANYDPVVSAFSELLEESCMLLNDNPHSRFLPFFVEVPGRSTHTKYRGYFMQTYGLSREMYWQKRGELERAEVSGDYLETSGMTHVPLREFSVEKLRSSQDVAAVRDIYGNYIHVNQRTTRLFSFGGYSALANYLLQSRGPFSIQSTEPISL